ncbi:MAG: hypothetical protein ACFFAS_02845 [Promethearchaeota archaeon]
MMEELIFNTYFIGAFLLRCIILYYVIKTARQLNLIAFYFLGLHFLLIGIINLLMGADIPNEIPILMDLIIYAIFIKMTFYKDKKGPFYLIITVIISLSILNFLLLIFAKYLMLLSLFSNINYIILHSWLFIISLSAYLKLRSYDSIKPWIRSRYILVIVYSIIGTFSQILFIINMGERSVNIMTFGLMISYIIIPLAEFLAWVMPAKFKNWLNRKYVYDEDIELSEEEIMNSFEGK